MPTHYSLEVQNNSYNSGDICVFATSPDTEKIQLNLKSLAWFSKFTHPNTRVLFEWDVDYSFVWSQTGELVPGVKFTASEVLEADPSEKAKSKAFFDMQNNAYLFGERSSALDVPAGALGISTSANVPHNRAAIGIAIGGNPALVVGATPNYQFTFIPKLRYWVAFGNFVKGEVLDINAMTKIHELNYPINVTDKIVFLNKDNTWSEGKTLMEYNNMVRLARANLLNG